MEKISLIIPFYNAENYISRLTQNINEACEGLEKSRFEIIFVDDWGLDNSRKLIEETNLFEFRIVDAGVNQGLGGARNLGVAKSTGQWIMFMDHDDLLAKGSLKIIMDKIESMEELNFIRFNYIEKHSTHTIEHKFTDYMTYAEAVFPVTAWSKVIKKELYVQSQNHLKYEDSLWTFDFIDSKLYKNIKYGFIDEELYTYDRTNEFSITTQIHVQDLQVVYSRLVETLNSADEDIKVQLIAIYLYSLKYAFIKVKNIKAFLILFKNIPNISLKDYRASLNYLREK